VYGIPDFSRIFSSCLCNRPSAYPGSASAFMTDNFTIYLTLFFFASFTKLEEISSLLIMRLTIVQIKSIKTLPRGRKETVHIVID
jgi:hypothetical protein